MTTLAKLIYFLQYQQVEGKDGDTMVASGEEGQDFWLLHPSSFEF